MYGRSHFKRTTYSAISFCFKPFNIGTFSYKFDNMDLAVIALKL